MKRIKEQRQKAQGKEDVEMSDLLDSFAQKARDHARTPMQVRTYIASHPFLMSWYSGTPVPTVASRLAHPGCA
jgi:hypothetical protein